MKASELTSETKVSSPIENINFDNIGLSFQFSGRDLADPNNPLPVSYQENVNLQLNNESELNRVLSEKPYLLDIIPLLVERFKHTYDSENIAAKNLIIAVKTRLKQPKE